MYGKRKLLGAANGKVQFCTERKKIYAINLLNLFVLNSMKCIKVAVAIFTCYHKKNFLSVIK